MRRAILCVTVSLVALASIAAADFDRRLFLSSASGQLVAADVGTGEVESIGVTGAPFTDIAFDPDDRLFGVTWDSLFEIDPHSGTTTYIGAHGFPGARNEINALVVGADGTAYAAGNDILLALDLESGAGTYLGTLSGYNSAGDLAFDADGRLLLTTDTGELVEVHVDGSGAVAIGDLPFDDIYAFAATPEGELYGVRARREIVAIDAHSGLATVVGSLQSESSIGSVWGGSFPTDHLPEASTALLCLTGGALLSRRRLLPLR